VQQKCWELGKPKVRRGYSGAVKKADFEKTPEMRVRRKKRPSWLAVNDSGPGIPGEKNKEFHCVGKGSHQGGG